MATVQKHFVASAALIALISGLSACAKNANDGRLQKTEITTVPPSTSPDPAQAVKEHKEADEKAEQAKLAAIEAAKKSGSEIDLKAIEEAEAAATAEVSTGKAEALAAALDAVTSEATDNAKKDGATSASVPEVAASVPAAAASAAVTPQSNPIPEVKLEVPKTDGSAAAAIAATAEAEKKAEKSGELEKAVVVSPATGASAATTGGATGAVKTDTNVDEQTKIQFVKSFMESSMRLNNEIYLQRREILRLYDKMEVQKQKLSAAEEQWLTEINIRSLNLKTASKAQLLEKIDLVSTAMIAAPLALRTNWGLNAKITEKRITTVMRELNISPRAAEARYRSARASLQGQAGVTSVQLMKALLADSKDSEKDAVLATIPEILRLMGAPEVKAEIKRVHDILDEENKKSVKPRLPQPLIN